MSRKTTFVLPEEEFEALNTSVRIHIEHENMLFDQMLVNDTIDSHVVINHTRTQRAYYGLLDGINNAVKIDDL